MGIGGAALALTGCGDDDDDSGSDPTAAPGATQAPAATQPKVGGTLRYPLAGLLSGDPPSLDPNEGPTYLWQYPAALHYSRLLRGASGPDILESDYTKLEGDLAAALPEQPDDLTYVFTLKPNITFHDKPPMNGRIATAGDYAETYKAFLSLSKNASRYSGVIASLEASDDRTITVKLKAPFAPFMTTHAAADAGPWFIPVETINSNLVKSDAVGTGPWVFRQWNTGVGMRWDRHAKFHDGPTPYFERVEAAMVKDPQRILSALQAGELDLSPQLSASQYPDIKSRLDPAGQLNVTQGGGGNGFIFNFDVKPWNDKRVRQALSMALDRDGYLKVQDPTGEGDWSSFMGPAMRPYYMSPKNDAAEFGPNAKYFQKNITEAKALLTAAGYPDGLSFKIISNVDRYGAVLQQAWELVSSTISEAGFNAENVYQEYSAYIQSTYVGNLPEDSVGLGPLIGTVLDPDDMFFTSYSSTSNRHQWGGTPIPEMADLDSRFVKQRTILDLDERIEAVKEIQRVMADSMLTVMLHSVPGVNYVQPWVKNSYWKSSNATPAETYAKAYFTDERIAKG
ncbi:MAG: ABC transporter substrate-binding protein [Tepidiformaceae bacterium]